jgi:threonine dehydrogenase-like Zn-dependent dehydrogenase
MVIPLENLHRVPESVADEQAVWTEPLAAALAVQEAGMRPGDRVLVLGDGKLGALIALGLGLRGIRIDLVGRNEAKLRLLDALGVSIKTEDPRPVYPFVIEATGHPQGLEEALAWTQPRATLVLKSTCHQPVEFDRSRIVVDEIRLVGSRCGDFQPAIEALSSGSLPLGRLVSKTFPLAKACEAIVEAGKPETFKVFVDMNRG